MTVHVERVMGTVVTIDGRDDVPPPAISDVVAWFHHVDATFSPWIADSAISRFGHGRLPDDERTADIDEVLDLCAHFRIETRGAFDAHAVPAPNGSRFDPSGVVKGWSVDRAAALLERHGLRCFAINAGGDVVVRGAPEPGRAWRVGVRHPDHADRVATVVEADGPLAVATSAAYERGPHIVDPRTGGTPTSLLSVTVVGPTLAEADAWATAAFVLGPTGLDALADHPHLEAFAITADRRVLTTPGWGRELMARSA